LDFSVRNLLLFLIALICYSLISFTERDSFIVLFSLVCFAYILYLFLVRKSLNFKSILISGLLFRLCFFFTEPQLSDDIYRFVWDGEIISNGLSPYEELPSDLGVIINENKDVYELMNSKNYYSVYPPVMQSVFYISSFFPGNLFIKITFFRLVLLLAEIAIMVLLARILSALKLNENGLIIYALNPLVIIETIGNLHFESMMICFFLFGFYILIRNAKITLVSLFLASIFFAFGIMTKLTLALILPVLLFFIPFRKLAGLGLLTVFFCIVLFLPFLSEVLVQNFSQSLDLYFRSFEFNASIFYLINSIGTKIKGWDTVQYIGPVLSLLSLILIAAFCILRKKQNWLSYFNLAQLAFFIYLLFSTTVHPWYIMNLIFLSVFTRKIYPLLWSLSVYLSYYMYSHELYEPPILLTVEYLLVGFVFFMETFMPNRTIDFLANVPLFQVDENPE